MDHRNSIEIARSLIQRYGVQALAVAEERVATLSEEDPQVRHIWEQVPAAVAELRRTQRIHAGDGPKLTAGKAAKA